MGGIVHHNPMPNGFFHGKTFVTYIHLSYLSLVSFLEMVDPLNFGRIFGGLILILLPYVPDYFVYLLKKRLWWLIFFLNPLLVYLRISYSQEGYTIGRLNWSPHLLTLLKMFFLQRLPQTKGFGSLSPPENFRLSLFSWPSPLLMLTTHSFHIVWFGNQWYCQG